jgi:D-amino peptidase
MLDTPLPSIRKGPSVKVYIETDMEGASGVWKAAQVDPSEHAEYEYGRRRLEHDVNVVVDAAFAAGANEVILRDGHGPGAMDWSNVDPRASVERRGSLPIVFPGLDDSCDCVFMIGCHAMAGTPRAFLEHTQSSREWFDFRINGQPQGEVGQLAAYAGFYGVPLAMISGDRAVCTEISRLFPWVATAEVKKAVWRGECSCHSAKHCEEVLRARTAEALDNVRGGKAQPWVLAKPVEIELVVQRVELADKLPVQYRVGPRTFRKRVADQRMVITIEGPESWPEGDLPLRDKDV